MHHLILILHLLAATIWVGGHLILLLKYVPEAFKNNTLNDINFFRKNFERLGKPALVILLVTGVILAYDHNIPVQKWFQFEVGIEKIVSLKLILFFSTLVLGFSAVKFVFPSLKNKPTALLYIFILLLTLISVAMLVLGSLVRIGGL